MVACIQPKPVWMVLLDGATVGPQLPLAAEPVRGLHQGQQHGSPQLADRGNLAQYFHSLMVPTLG